MTWNYRILAYDNEDTTTFGIHQVYYNENNKPINYSRALKFHDINDISWTLDKMKECVNKPILSIKNFPNEFNVEKINEFNTGEFNEFNVRKIINSNCLHENCTSCNGTGIKRNGEMCIHLISCPCQKCTPR